MMSIIALGMVLSLSQLPAGELQMTNDRPTYGIMGSTRMEVPYLPGDAYVVTADVQGLKVGDDGKILYKMAMVVTNPKGEVQFSRDPQDLEAILSLGGNSLPVFAGVEIGTDWTPGEYTLKLTVTDRAASKEALLIRKFTVSPKGFGLVLVNTTYNQNAGLPAPAVGVAGQPLFVNMAVVGFERSSDKKEPAVVVGMLIVDEQGNPTFKKPVVHEMDKDLARTNEVVPVSIPLALNRPGKFTLKLKAVDQVSKKTNEVTLPIVVYDSNVSGGK